MMALSGVRSSWLMLARNWLLARLAASAAALACASWPMAFMRAVSARSGAAQVAGNLGQQQAGDHRGSQRPQGQQRDRGVKWQGKSQHAADDRGHQHHGHRPGEKGA